jgi:hypothetical protein
MAIIKRNQVTKKEHEVAVTENDFLAKAEDYQIDHNLKELSLDELVIRFEDIDRQSHLLKGKILLEARSRFESDKEFGRWVSTQSNCLGRSQKTRNRLMHLAGFFTDNKDLEGISISAAYEISSPLNKEIAEKVYEEAHEKNLSLKEVKILLIENSEKNKYKPKILTDTRLSIEEKLVIKIVDTILKGETVLFKRNILQKALEYLNNKNGTKHKP